MGMGYRPEEATITDELCHGVQRVAQPVPFLLKSPSGVPVSDGGNCYACALQCVLNHFGVAPGVDGDAVFQAIDRFKRHYHGSEQPYIAQTESGMDWALKNATDLEFECNKIPPLDFAPEYGKALGFMYNREFVDQFEQKLKSGHLIIAGVHANNARQDQFLADCDHWVVIDGVKTVRVPFYREDGTSVSARLERYFRFVDSSTVSPGTYWVEEFHLIRYFGCAASFFVRKRV